MILTGKRTFKREEPSEDAKLFIVICEGLKREAQYFEYFSELDSRINIEIVKPEDGVDFTPEGMITVADMLTVKSEENPNPKYTLTNEDEVWFVIDTDDWGEKIDLLREYAKNKPNFYVAQSNPCFEVWLAYHFVENVEEFSQMGTSKNWKAYLHKKLPGGFDSKKHPIFISRAIFNAKKNFEKDLSTDKPEIGSTEVFVLADRIYSIISRKIDSALTKFSK